MEALYFEQANCCAKRGRSMKKIVAIFLIIILILSGCASGKGLTREQVYEGVDRYCHSRYNWSPAEDNPEIMYVAMGEETETEYTVIFRSYTGALVHFYVNKETGSTRMVETVPSLGVEEEVGSIDLHDYLK